LKCDIDLCEFCNSLKCKSKDKAVPVQAWTDPEGTRRLKFPDFKAFGT